MPLPDPRTRRTPGTGTPGLGKLNDDESTLSLPQSSDATATPADATALDKWRRRLDHGLEQLTRLCPWCQTQLADPDIDSCHGCREVGSGDVYSPRGDAA